MLNNVDLPQPDGPMMDTNSPGAIENDTSSTAVITPSLVTKRLLTCSTSSRRSSPESGAAVPAAGERASAPFMGSIGSAPALHKRGAHRRGVARLDVNVDDCDCTVEHRTDSLLQRRRERVELLDRAPALRTLRAPDCGKIHIGIGNALADPFVLDGPVAHARNALLVHLVVVERKIVCDDQQ